MTDQERAKRQRLTEIRKRMEALNAAENFGETEQREWDVLKAETQRINAWLERNAEAAELPVAAMDTETRAEDNMTPQGAPAVHKRRVPDTPEGIYCHYLRTNDPMAAAELRAYNNTDMNVTTAADGEVAVPVGMVQDIVARRDEMALWSKLGVRRVPGKGTTVNYPIDNEADVLFAAVNESGTVGQDAPALTEKAFTLVKYGKYITLTWEILRDEDANLLAFLSDWIARGWAATHNSLLVTEVLANGTAGLTLDAAAAIGAAEVPELVGKLAPEYQDNAQWLMHQGTWSYLQGLVSTSPFLFAPTPGGMPGAGPSLWNYPLNQSSYMTALGASVKSMVFGNFNFLGMREGTSMTTLRDPYTVATSGQVRLHYWFDAVYGVLQAEAIQYATHPSA